MSIWRNNGCNIQVKRYESDWILGLSVTIIIIGGASILFVNVYFPVACTQNYGEYFVCLGIISYILESHEEDHVCIQGDFNKTLFSPRFNEICDMLLENNVMFRDADILPDNLHTC